MSENKFKIGDKVKCIRSAIEDHSMNAYFTEGNIYTIYDYEVFPNGKGWITSINNFGDRDGYSSKFFELVEENPHTGSSFESALNDDAFIKFITNGPTRGTKNDSEKPDLSLIPTDALWGMGKALSYGAAKYDRHNFRKGIAYSRLVAATMRHLSAWNEGENIDAESKLSHLDHAIASLAMLKFMEVNKKDMDDRYFTKKVESLTEEEKLEAAKSIQNRGR